MLHALLGDEMSYYLPSIAKNALQFPKESGFFFLSNNCVSFEANKPR